MRTASVRLPADRVGRDVAQVVDDEQGARQAPGGAAHHDGERGHPLDGHVRRADGRHEPEEDEHEDLAETDVAVRHAAHRCSPTRRRSLPRRRPAATTSSSPPARDRRRRRRRRRANAARFTAPAGFRPGGDEAHRADPCVVRAAHAVAVVVGVVHADLEGQADDEGDDRRATSVTDPSPTAHAAPMATGTHRRPGSVQRSTRSRAATALMGRSDDGPMSELWQLSALELADLIRKQEASSREVLDALLARIDAVNGHLNAVVALLPEAVAAADAADRAVAGGADLGPLHGVPITVKENIDVAGSATTQGVAASSTPSPPSTPRSSSACAPPGRSRSPAPTSPTSGCASTPTRSCAG